MYDTRATGGDDKNMSQDYDLFLSLAEIAGVFVGFGALIGISRGASGDAVQLVRIRGVVSIGLLVVIAALIPVGLASYELAPATLWRTSSAVFLTLIWFAILIPFRDRSHFNAFRAQARANPVATAFFWIVLELSIQLPLLLAVFGMYPDKYVAFYTTALVINLFQAAFLLAELVFSKQTGTAEP